MATKIIEETDTLARTFAQPAEAFHPEQINYADFDNSPALKRASDTLGYAWDKLAAIDELRPNRSPLDTPASHGRKVASAVDSFSHEWGTRWDAARAGVMAELKTVDAQLDEAAGLKPNARFESAICGTFHMMTPAERAKAIADMIADGDTATLATLIDAPSVTTGLTAEVRGSIRERILRAKAPRLLAKREALTKAETKLQNAANRALPIVAGLRAGTDRHEARIKSAEAVAAKLAG